MYLLLFISRKCFSDSKANRQSAKEVVSCFRPRGGVHFKSYMAQLEKPDKEKRPHGDTKQKVIEAETAMKRKNELLVIR